MRKLFSSGLTKHLGEEVLVEREGIKGNYRHIDGRAKEGELTGILQRDEEGFYVKLFKSTWIGDFGNQMDRSAFMSECYRLRNMDIIRFLTPIKKYFGKGFSIRVN